MCYLRSLVVFLLLVVASVLPSYANSCLKGDVHDNLLSNYLPASQLQTSVREWAPYKGYILVSGNSIVVSFKFDEATISLFNTRTDFALEIDVVDFNDITSSGWSFSPSDERLEDQVIVKKDISNFDPITQLSLLILRPHLLQPKKEYKIEFKLDQPIQVRGKLKLNMDLSVSFPGTNSPLCLNPFFNTSDWTSGWNFWKLETEQYSEFWYTPNTSSGVCWVDREASDFGACTLPRGTVHDPGNLSLSPDGSGHVGLPGVGIQPFATESAPVQVPPDFVVKRTWLENTSGVESYVYSIWDSFNAKAQAKNIGDGSCLSGEISTIKGHFYLSNGYKEDSHSGSNAWRRIGNVTIQCSNLGPGATKTETANMVIRQWITRPGAYNIVYCIDHPQDDHNNGGDHQEKRESNNCSKEAVFVVRQDAIMSTFLPVLQTLLYD